MVLNMTRPGTFQKGHKFAIGSRGQIHRDLTIELISQLNEPVDKRQPSMTKLQRVVSNLIAQASGVDEYDEKGNLVKRGTGDLAAIMVIFDRVEGRVPRATSSSVSQSSSTRQPSSINSVNMPWQANCSVTGSASPTDAEAARVLIDQPRANGLQGVLNMTRPGVFQKGHKLAIGSRGQIRRDLTIELISQLDEIFDKRTGQTKLQRVVSNLVAQATGVDEYDEKGNLVKEGTGDLAAILAIFDRVEGKVPRATGSSVSQSGSTRQSASPTDDAAARDLINQNHADLQAVANRKSH
jgi:hypothetical protein